MHMFDPLCEFQVIYRVLTWQLTTNLCTPHEDLIQVFPAIHERLPIKPIPSLVYPFLFSLRESEPFQHLRRQVITFTKETRKGYTKLGIGLMS
jgi:hypothetical protein